MRKALGNFFSAIHDLRRRKRISVSVSVLDIEMEMVVISEATNPKITSLTSSANTLKPISSDVYAFSSAFSE